MGEEVGPAAVTAPPTRRSLQSQCRQEQQYTRAFCGYCTGNTGVLREKLEKAASGQGWGLRALFQIHPLPAPIPT